MTSFELCNIMGEYGELEMRALLRRSVFTLMYKEKCKWCENDRLDGFFYYGKSYKTLIFISTILYGKMVRRYEKSYRTSIFISAIL